jgi:hypothetical protein
MLIFFGVITAIFVVVSSCVCCEWECERPKKQRANTSCPIQISTNVPCPKVITIPNYNHQIQCPLTPPQQVTRQSPTVVATTSSMPSLLTPTKQSPTDTSTCSTTNLQTKKARPKKEQKRPMFGQYECKTCRKKWMSSRANE